MQPLLDIDHLACYRNGQLCYPCIYEGSVPIPSWAQGCVICLKAQPEDEFDWKASIHLAEQLIEQGKWILWELDLGFNERLIDLSDQGLFYSHTIAIQEFSSQIWKNFSHHSLGLILYRGSGNFSSQVIHLQERFAEEKERNENLHSLEIYGASLFGEYLHRLISFLPDEVQPFACIDAAGVSSNVLAALMFSRRYFEYLHLAVCGSPLPIPGFCWKKGGSFAGWMGSERPPEQPRPIPSRALCLPPDAFCNDEVLNKLERVLSSLLDSGEPFRLICEERLTEEWNNLDQLIVCTDQLSPQGKRMLQGFVAAGGVVTDAGTILSAEDKADHRASLPL